MIILAFDTETTGVMMRTNPDFRPKLVQLGAILQDIDTGRILAEINLINSDCGPIPVEASNIHGITDRIAQSYGISVKLIDHVFARLVAKADILVAHNIDFDSDIVAFNLPVTQGCVRGKPTFCTMDSNVYVVKAPLTQKQKDYFTSKGSKPDRPYKVPSLMQTYQHYFSTEFDGAHDAMSDIRACRDIFMQMVDEGYLDVTGPVLAQTSKLTGLSEQAS